MMSLSSKERRSVLLVDSHVHVWKNDPKYPWAPGLARAPEEDATVERLLDVMTHHGTEKTVLVQVIYYTWDNRYTADCLKRHPDRFEAVCRVDPESPSAADDLSCWVEEHGFRGVRLSPGVGPEGDWFISPDLHPLWQRAQDLRVPVCILTHLDRLPDLEKLVQRFGEVPVCVDHMAFPPVDGPEELPKLLNLAKYPTVYVKVSGTWAVSKEPYPYRDTHEIVHRVYDAFGPKRLMWGTDWPLVENKCGYTGALDLPRREFAFLTDEDKKWVLGRTACTLWPFDRS